MTLAEVHIRTDGKKERMWDYTINSFTGLETHIFYNKMKTKATSPCPLCQFCEASARGRAPSGYSYLSCHIPFPLRCVLLPEVPESAPY